MQEVMSWQDLSYGKGAMGDAQVVQRMSLTRCAKTDFCGRRKVCGESVKNVL